MNESFSQLGRPRHAAEYKRLFTNYSRRCIAGGCTRLEENFIHAFFFRHNSNANPLLGSDLVVGDRRRRRRHRNNVDVGGGIVQAAQDLVGCFDCPHS